jgi:hypothetical protein
MKKPLVILFCILLSFLQHVCAQERIMEMQLRIADKEPTPETISKALEIVSKRISIFCNSGFTVRFDTLSRLVKIRLPEGSDTAFYHDLILRKGQFEILETYEQEELSANLNDIDKMLMKAAENGISLSDASTLPKNFRLYTILIPPVDHNGKFFRGSGLGTVRTADTLQLKRLFRLPEVKALIPADADLKLNKYLDDLYSLIATKNPVGYMYVSGEMIDSAGIVAEDGEVEEGKEPRYSLWITLKHDYYKNWITLANKNNKRSIAMVIDNEVYSHPTVKGKFTSDYIGKRIGISSYMGLKKAQMLSTVLMFGKIPVTFQ